MRDQRQETLLKLLQTNAYVTAERLGASLNVSEKTVRNFRPRRICRGKIPAGLPAGN